MIETKRIGIRNPKCQCGHRPEAHVFRSKEPIGFQECLINNCDCERYKKL